MHADSALVAMERNRVMKYIVAPYMTWQPCGPDSIHNCPYLYNSHMDLSVWDPPLQLDGHSSSKKRARDASHAGDGSTADQAVAHAVRRCPVLSSGVPPEYEYQLQMQSMQSTQDMLETAPVIVSDSTLLHWSDRSGKLVKLGKAKGYIICGYGKILLSLPKNMKDDILGGAVRHAKKIDSRARVGYIPLQQCGHLCYSEYGRHLADKVDALAALVA